MFAQTMKNCVGEIGREGKKIKLLTKTNIKGPTILLRGLRWGGGGVAARWIRIQSDIYDLNALMGGGRA